MDDFKKKKDYSLRFKLSWLKPLSQTRNQSAAQYEPQVARESMYSQSLGISSCKEICSAASEPPCDWFCCPLITELSANARQLFSSGSEYTFP